MREGGIKWLPFAGASGILRSREVHFMPKKHGISTKRAVIYGILGFLAVLLILYVIYCQIPRPMIPDKESRFEPHITSVCIGTSIESVWDQLDEDTQAELMDLMRSVRYRHRVFPTGIRALELKDDMIRIELSWVPNRIGSGWSFREIILTPEWQTVKNGDDWNWMHPIEDGEALYEQVYELIYG